MTVLARNNAPDIYFEGDANYIGGGSPLTIVDSSAELSDVDSANLASLTVTLTTRPDGDSVESLSLNTAADTAADDANLTVVYTAATGVLSITGQAAASVYQDVLRGVVYNNTDSLLNATAGERTITVVARDVSEVTPRDGEPEWAEDSRELTLKLIALGDVGDNASPVFADLDHDGDLDAFVGNYNGDTLYYENEGSVSSPNFATTAVTNPFGLSNVGNNAKPTFADIDRDGDLDAFIGNFNGDTLYFENTGLSGTSTFAAPATTDPFNPFGLQDVGSAASPTFADIDGDGDLDALIGSGEDDIFYFENLTITSSGTGTPAFATSATPPSFVPSSVGGYDSPALVDIDDDGDPDAFIGNSSGDTLFFLNPATPAPTPTPTPSPDPTPTPTDNDGASDTEEGAAPGLPPTGGGTAVAGDGNGDGVVDSQQSNVTSVPFRNTDTAVTNPGTAPQTYVSLVADARDGKIDTTDTNTATLTNVRQLDAPANLPANVQMPLGLISFSSNVGTPGTLETFSLYVDPALGVNAYFKQNTAGTWVNIASAQYGGKVVTEGGKTRLDFQIKDGGEFDSDGKADGTITDPGAPGISLAISKDTDRDQFPDALEAANGLTVGIKDNDVFTSSKFFAMQLYRDILYREGETAGVAYWQNRIDTGLSRAETAVAFLDSPEFQAGTGAIARLYFGTLQRLPDAPGMSFWMEQQQSGTPVSQIAAAFVASTEFTAIYGTLSDTAFINAQYQSVLGRSATAQEQTQWSTQLAAGANRGTVLLGLTESNEYKLASDTKLSVALDYLGLLGRPAEQAGFDYWVNLQNTTVPEVTVVGGFIASPEYHDRFLP